MQTDFGLYIHIPFCRQKCFYCDFPSFAGRERYIAAYLNALSREMELLADRCGETGKLHPRTVYIGGGTPSHLSLEQMEILFQSIQANTSLSDVAEFTMEANPCSLNEEKLYLMKKSGVNRLSIGVQSFDDTCLKKIGRLHNAREAVEKVKKAQEAGFTNISIDLMYGLPNQTMDILQASVEQALNLGIQHISIYGLQVEEGTVFAKQRELAKLVLPEDELVDSMYDYIVEKLPKSGYERYEISNYALRGHESQHNSLYWQDVPYLGLGAGAHSYWGGNRYENPDNIEDYTTLIQENKVFSQMEELADEQAHMEEFCFLGLRMSQGIDKEKFKAKFSRDIHEVFGEAIQEMTAKELLRESEKNISLTAVGMKYGNVVFSSFIIC